MSHLSQNYVLHGRNASATHDRRASLPMISNQCDLLSILRTRPPALSPPCASSLPVSYRHTHPPSLSPVVIHPPCPLPRTTQWSALPLGDIKRLTADICSAVDFVHSHSVVHQVRPSLPAHGVSVLRTLASWHALSLAPDIRNMLRRG